MSVNLMEISSDGYPVENIYKWVAVLVVEVLINEEYVYLWWTRNWNRLLLRWCWKGVLTVWTGKLLVHTIYLLEVSLCMVYPCPCVRSVAAYVVATSQPTAFLRRSFPFWDFAFCSHVVVYLISKSRNWGVQNWTSLLLAHESKVMVIWWIMMPPLRLSKTPY